MHSFKLSWREIRRKPESHAERNINKHLSKRMPVRNQMLNINSWRCGRYLMGKRNQNLCKMFSQAGYLAVFLIYCMHAIYTMLSDIAHLDQKWTPFFKACRS